MSVFPTAATDLTRPLVATEPDRSVASSRDVLGAEVAGHLVDSGERTSGTAR